MTRPSAEESRELKTLVLVTGPSVGEPRFGAGRRGCHCHNGTPPATRMTRPADKNRSVLAASSRAPCRRSSAVRWPCDAFCVRQRGGVGVGYALRAELRDRDLEERGQLLRVLREAPDPAVGVVQDHELPAGGLSLPQPAKRGGKNGSAAAPDPRRARAGEFLAQRRHGELGLIQEPGCSPTLPRSATAPRWPASGTSCRTRPRAGCRVPRRFAATTGEDLGGGSGVIGIPNN